MQLYHSSNEAWKAMSQACASAEKTIDFEEYIIHDDHVGNQLLDVFMAKARDGLRVRILLDGFGSRRLHGNQVVSRLYEAGAQLVFYRPLNSLQSLFPTLALPRDHVKALHIDGGTSFIGSMCVAQHMVGWRDTLVAMDGHAAKRAQLDFDRAWCNEALFFEYRPCVDSHKDEPQTDTYMAQIPELGIATILDAMLLRIGSAKRSVLIATPYFFPPSNLRKALLSARARGVAITLMLSNQTDIPLADTVTRGLLDDWHHAGFTVVFYQPNVLHAKYAIIDEEWVTVGSCNFDFLSLKHNREANIVLRKPQHVEEFLRQSQRDMTYCLPSPSPKKAQNEWDQAVGKFGALVCRFV